MLHRTVTVMLCALASAAAFTSPASRPALVQQRAASLAMQFGGGKSKETLPRGWKKVPSASRAGQFSYLNTKTGQRYDRLPASLMGGGFYDDEIDTVSKPAWSIFAREQQEQQQYRSSAEAAGFGENGEDLANAGGALYLAFVPFLAFALFYFVGNGPNPYGSFGNF